MAKLTRELEVSGTVVASKHVNCCRLRSAGARDARHARWLVLATSITLLAILLDSYQLSSVVPNLCCTDGNTSSLLGPSYSTVIA